MKKQLFTSFLLIGVFLNVFSQTPIRVAHVVPFIHNESKTYTLNGITYKFGTDADPSLANPLQLQSFEAKTPTTSSVYSYVDQKNADLEIFLRRNLTRTNTISRDILYIEGRMMNNEFHTKYPYLPTIEENFYYRFIGVGSDNSFHNYHVTQGPINNIERIDIINRTGIIYNSNTEGGIAVFERGIVGQHDGVIVGIITGIDANGVPTSYASTFKPITSAQYGNTNIYTPGSGYIHAVGRRDRTVNPIPDFAYTNTIAAGNGIGGVFIGFEEFDLPPNTTIYGYSLLPNHFYQLSNTANRAQVALDWENSTYFMNNNETGDYGSGSIDLTTIAGFSKKISISGNILHDMNGLTDNLINGNPVNTIDQQPLYVYVVRRNGATTEILDVVPVDANGNFTSSKVSLDTLDIIVSTNNQGTIGSTWNNSYQSLPSNWVATGESQGVNNNLGQGLDQTVDGKVSLKLTDVNITDVQLAIEKRPEVQNQTYNVPNTAFSNANQSPGNGYPAIPNYSYIPMNSSELANSNGDGSLKGTDLEDCPNNQCPSQTFFIETINTNTKIYYDFGGSIGVAEVIPNTPTGKIENFDPNKLVIYGQTSTGDATNPIQFQYTLVDNAGLKSTPATYSIIVEEPLPIKLISFKATLDHENVILNWITEKEEEISHFEILRSTNSDEWNTIYKTNARNNTSKNVYTHIDENIQKGIHLYKLAIIDQDGSKTESKVAIVNNSSATNVKVFPNPAQDIINITNIGSYQSVIVYDALNKAVIKKAIEGNQIEISLQHLPNGVYHVKLSNQAGQSESIKFIINK